MEQYSNRVTATKIGKKAFVGGLFWQSLTQPQKLKVEAAELAKKNNFDLYLIRQGDGVAQTGLAGTGEGYVAGMVSLAASIAHRISDEGVIVEGSVTRAHNWIGALELPDGRWIYLAVRDDAIMPTGDFVGTKEEAISLLEQNFGLGGWAAVIGPKEIQDYGYHNFVAKSLEELLGMDKRGTPKHTAEAVLKSFKLSVSPKLVVVAIIVVGAVFASVGAFKNWKLEQEQKALEAAMEVARQQEAAKQQLAAVNAAAPHPWATDPLVMDMAAACESGFAQLAPGGWVTDSVTCSTNAIVYGISRGFSTVLQLRNAEEGAVIDEDGQKGSVQKGVRFQVMRDEELGRSRDLTEKLLDVAQRAGVKASIRMAPAPAPAPRLPGDNSPVVTEPIPDWNTHALQIGPTTASPTAVLPLFDEPGVRVEKITYSKGEWLYEGHLYAR